MITHGVIRSSDKSIKLFQFVFNSLAPVDKLMHESTGQVAKRRQDTFFQYLLCLALPPPAGWIKHWIVSPGFSIFKQHNSHHTHFCFWAPHAEIDSLTCHIIRCPVWWRKRCVISVTPAINPAAQATSRAKSSTTGPCLYFKSPKS